MMRAAEAQVREIEERLALGRADPAARERDARVFAVLVKTLRELTALDAMTQSDSGASEVHDDDDGGPRDLDEFRRELAMRIHSFVSERESGRIPGDADASVD